MVRQFLGMTAILAILLISACSAGSSASSGSGSERPPTAGATSPAGTVAPPTRTAAPTTTTTAAPPATTTDPLQEQVDQEQAFLRQGVVAYRAPNPMQLGGWQEVAVRVSGATPPPGFTSGLPGTGVPITTPVQVGPQMRAVLQGPGFDVVPVGQDNGDRTLSSDGTADWAWNVQPLQRNAKTLELTLYVIEGDGNPPVSVRTITEQVQVSGNVKYSLGRWFDDHWGQTGITIPVLCGAVFGVWKFIQSRRRRRAAARAPEPDKTAAGTA